MTEKLECSKSTGQSSKSALKTHLLTTMFDESYRKALKKDFGNGRVKCETSQKLVGKQTSTQPFDNRNNVITSGDILMFTTISSNCVLMCEVNGIGQT